MLPPHLEMLLSLARAGLAARAERLPSAQLSEAASAIAAGEGYLVALKHQPPAKETKPEGG